MATIQLTFTYSEHDYLQYYLYYASTSQQQKKALRYNRWLWTFVFLVLGACCRLWELNMTALFFVAVAIIWFLFYPYRHRARYKQHYQDHIKRTCIQNMERQNNIRIQEDMLFITDGHSETKMPITEISGIAEITDEIFITVKTAGAIILPKNQIQDLAGLKQLLTDISARVNVTYVTNLEWRWNS